MDTAGKMAPSTSPASTSETETPPPPEARGGFPPPNLRLFLSLLALLLALFTLLRLSLVLRVKSDGDATWSELARSFLVGARFDLSAACMMLAPILLLCHLPWTTPWRGPQAQRVFVVGLTALIAVAAFLLVAEAEFFREFQTRYNQLAVRYLDQPKIVGSMIWYNYPVVRYLLAAAVGAAILWALIRWVVRRAGRLAAAPPFGTAAWKRLAFFEVVSGFLIVSVIVVGARGGLQTEPLRWGDAFKGDNEFASQMSLNGLWCLFQVFRDTVTRGGDSKGWEKRMAGGDARELVRGSLLASSNEQLIDPANRTVLRKGDVGSSITLSTASGKPVNVVVVMMESFSARFCGAAGAPRSFTPALDALAKDGVLFDRCFSAGSHTHQGIFATQLGFPNLPGYETLMQSGAGNQEFLSLPGIFQTRGYKTFFLYNGNFAWDNMQGFFRKQGIERFIGGDEMLADAKFRDHVWGVSDGDLFDRCNREFEAAAANGPFYAAVMTLSNHAPFEVPPVAGAAPITDMGDLNRRLTAMRYADDCVGRFIEDAKKLNYFKNTLFVFVGDHGFGVKPVLTEVNLLYHHVPLLFYAPGLISHGPGDASATTQAVGLAARIDHRVASHMNITPSVLGLLGLSDAEHASWGRSLFADGFPDPNYAVFKMTGGGTAVALAQGDDLLVFKDAKAEPQLMKYTLWPASVTPEAGMETADKKKAMARLLRAYVQAALNDLTTHAAGPVNVRSK